ncbi:phosphatase PAP2 family protein [Pontibacter litorisediminis]|uniref:phosphatase PAP2 family protein n=1 Tax=Pontibacter litorisediminis TaxID=1846260 RepID=UPI0023EDFF01|nr:phosphatase PAP2 family protein [Pontibacter litorisediminis]
MLFIQYLAMLLFIEATTLDVFYTLDLETLELLNGSRLVLFDVVLLFLTDTAYAIGALLPVCFYVAGYFRKDKNLKLKAVQYVLAMGLTVLIVGTLKYAVDRPRPFLNSTTITQLAETGSPSFPSGHTACAVTAAVTLALMVRNNLFRAVVLAWALLIAYSRLALGVHYPSDVLTSVLLGTLAAILTDYAFRKHLLESPLVRRLGF